MSKWIGSTIRVKQHLGITRKLMRIYIVLHWADSYHMIFNKVLYVGNNPNVAESLVNISDISVQVWLDGVDITDSIQPGFLFEM